jgi:hypothetical protein
LGAGAAAIIKNPHVTSGHLTKALDSDYMRVRRDAINHEKISDTHFKQVMRGDDYGSREIKQHAMAQIPTNPKITHGAIKHAFDNGSRETREVIGKNTNLPHELMHHVMNNSHDEGINAIVKSRLAHRKEIDSMLDSIADDPLVRGDK